MNIFRLAGDMTHLMSVIVLLLKIHTIKPCAGSFPLPISLPSFHFRCSSLQNLDLEVSNFRPCGWTSVPQIWFRRSHAFAAGSRLLLGYSGCFSDPESFRPWKSAYAVLELLQWLMCVRSDPLVGRLAMLYAWAWKLAFGKSLQGGMRSKASKPLKSHELALLA